MDNKTILTGIALGLLAALLSLAPLRVPGIGLFLSIFGSMPIFLAGFGFGPLCALIAAIAAVLAAFVFGQSGPALSVALMAAIPGFWVSRLANLSRPLDENNETAGQEWFPLSGILFRLSLYAAGLVMLLGAFIGFTVDNASELISAMLKEAFKQGAFGESGMRMPSPAQIETQSLYLAKIIPLLMPASLLLLFLINMALAARIARARGWMARDRDYVPAATGLPLIAVGLFAAGIVLTLLGGGLGLIGKALAGALGMAFAFVGLATLHFVMRNESGKGITLAITYAAILLISPVVLIFTILGVTETLLGLRARHAGGPPSKTI